MRKFPKHLDNKNDLIRAMKRTRIEAQHATEVGFTSNRMLSIYVLSKVFGFDQEMCERFVIEVSKADETVSLDELRQYLVNEVGMIVELPTETVRVSDAFDVERI